MMFSLVFIVPGLRVVRGEKRGYRIMSSVTTKENSIKDNINERLLDPTFPETLPMKDNCYDLYGLKTIRLFGQVLNLPRHSV